MSVENRKSGILKDSINPDEENSTFKPQRREKVKEHGGGQTESFSRTKEIDSLRLLFLENKALRATIDEQSKKIKIMLSNCNTFTDNEETRTVQQVSADISTENEKFPNLTFLEQQNIDMKAVLREQRNDFETILASFEKVAEDNIREMAEMKDQSAQTDDNETVTITVGVIDYLILAEVSAQDIKQVETTAEYILYVVSETLKIAQWLKTDIKNILPDLRIINTLASRLKKFDELFIPDGLRDLLRRINGVAMYVPRIVKTVSNIQVNFTGVTEASRNFENEVEHLFKKLKKAHRCFNGIKNLLHHSRTRVLDELDIIMTEMSETITTLTDETRNFTESFHLQIESANYLYNRAGEITSLNDTATEVVMDQLEKRTDVPILETVSHFKTISNEIWTTVQQVIAGTKTLITELTESKITAKIFLNRSRNIHKEINKMQEYICEVTRPSENVKHQDDDPRIAGIGQENPTLRFLQQENRKLELILEEYQISLEMIMSKYRQHVTNLVGSSKIDLSKSCNKKYSEIIIQQAFKIKEIAEVMHKAVQLDEEETIRIKEEIQRLITENKGLRELSTISTDLQEYGSADKDDTQQV